MESNANRSNEAEDRINSVISQPLFILLLLLFLSFSSSPSSLSSPLLTLIYNALFIRFDMANGVYICF